MERFNRKIINAVTGEVTTIDYTDAEQEAQESSLEEAKIESAKVAYIEKRRDEYPSIQDVTVALAEKAEGDSTMWDDITAKRAKVKADHPKP